MKMITLPFLALMLIAPVFLNAQEEVFKVVESMPRFPGCEDESDRQKRDECSKEKLFMFVAENVQYPKAAKDKGIEGTAVIEFIIEKDGKVSNAKILRDPGEGTGKEALRVVNLMPDFIPGTQRGKKVRVQYTLPIKFKLDSDKKDKEK